jgi:hypothetical protein
MKFYAAYVPLKEYWIVLTGNSVVQTDLSEDAAGRMIQFLNAQEFLNTDSRVRSEKPIRLEFDFDSIYERYPRKIGKKTGYERLKKQITTPEKYRLLSDAVDNYCKLTQGQDEKYILHFSTFASRWQDFIPEDAVFETTQEKLGIDDITKLLDN